MLALFHLLFFFFLLLRNSQPTRTQIIDFLFSPYHRLSCDTSSFFFSVDLEYPVSLHLAAGGNLTFNSLSVTAVEALISQDPAGVKFTDLTKRPILDTRPHRL